MKNTDDFRYKGKASHATVKLTPFDISKDKWDIKEDTGKSMKNALYVLLYAKRHVSRLNSEKINPSRYPVTPDFDGWG